MPNRFCLCLVASTFVIGMHSLVYALSIESDLQLKYANSLFSNKQYLRAAEEYQRWTFFFPNHSDYRRIVFKTGKSFLLAKKPEYALELFQQLSSISSTDDIAIEVFFKIADCHLQLNAPTQAVVELTNLIASSENSDVKDRAYSRIGWIHIEFANWSGAKNAFAEISPDGQKHYEVARLNRALTDTDHLPAKNPILAGMLSIIPGGGQLYCNRPQDASIAFIVNTGLFWAAYDAFDNEQYGLGGLLAFVGFGFYTGNIYGAVNDAHKFNHQQTRQFVDELKQFQIQLSSQPYNTTEQGLLFSLKIPF